VEDFDAFVRVLLGMPLISGLWSEWDDAERAVLLGTLLTRVTAARRP
jgi:hypothetical protein